MKFVCRRCEKFMAFQDVEMPGIDGAMGITFNCDGCDASFSMVTNAGETQMVKSLGVTLGGRTDEAAAFELTQAVLKEGANTEENGNGATAAHATHHAQAELAQTVGESAGKCPFANKMAVSYAKEEAQQGPSTTAGILWTDTAMTRLQNVPSEIRPIARQLIEGMARDQGSREVDDQLMDLARDTFM